MESNTPTGFKLQYSRDETTGKGKPELPGDETTGKSKTPTGV